MQLIDVCKSPLLEQGSCRFVEAKLCTPTLDVKFGGLYLNTPEHHTASTREPSPERPVRWSGTDFIKSPTEEPYVSSKDSNSLYLFL